MQNDRYSEQENKEYLSHLTRHAKNEGIENPVIFSTSAQNEQNNRQSQSGFGTLRKYINTKILNNAAEEKLHDDLRTLQQIFKQINNEFSNRRIKYETDNKVRKKINNIISEQETNIKERIISLTDDCLSTFDKNTNYTLEKINNEVGFLKMTKRSISNLFGKTPRLLNPTRTHRRYRYGTEHLEMENCSICQFPS